MFVYRERVCLIQFNCGGELFMLDGLTLPPGPDTLAPWAPYFADPERPLYLHGGEYDVAVFKRDFGLSFGGVFDTQQAALFLGFDRTSYAYLTWAFCDVELEKAHAQYDWGTRPISPSALRYALDDVVYLPRIVDAIKPVIEAADLIEEVNIAGDAVSGAAPHPAGFDAQKLWKLKGATRLGDRELAVLTALYQWRDSLAEAQDKPPGRLIANAALVSLARHAPASKEALRQAGSRGRFTREHGDELITIVQEALKNPPDLPKRQRTGRPSQEVQARSERLRSWRKAEAEARGVPNQVIMPNRALEYIEVHGPDALADAPQFGAKRIARYADALKDVAR
jgi:ribonuclease D